MVARRLRQASGGPAGVRHGSGGQADASSRRRAGVRNPLIVVKFGGELLETPDDLRRVARGIAGLATQARLVVVHGGGREIDTALAVAGISKQQVDGLRITDAATLEVVVSVLAGAVNTRLVAAMRAAGARPVGLTGADAGVALVRRAAPIETTEGTTVDLGLVGTPIANGTPELLADLVKRSYVPVVACIGATRRGELLNVNADTLAAHLASALGASRLVMAGGTPGVLDAAGHTIARLSSRAAARLIAAGTANRGMVAKLHACRLALARGVGDVLIADGRTVPLDTLWKGDAPASGCTQVRP